MTNFYCKLLFDVGIPCVVHNGNKEKDFYIFQKLNVIFTNKVLLTHIWHNIVKSETKMNVTGAPHMFLKIVCNLFVKNSA